MERDLLSLGTVRTAFMVCPVLGAAAGYLVHGVPGATSRFLIPRGPLIQDVALRDTLTMRYERYGRGVSAGGSIMTRPNNGHLMRSRHWSPP